MGKNFYFTENGLGSALRKLYKGKNGEFVYAQYKTKRTKQDIIIALKKQLFIYFQHIR